MNQHSMYVVIFSILALMPISTGQPSQTAQVNANSIVFASDRDGQFNIYVMDSDGSNQQQLTQGSNPNTEPNWSPDRQQIAFTSERDETSEIYVMNAEGSNQRRLTHNHGTNISPSWSPDGQQIAFISNQGGKNDLYILDVNNNSERQLTTDPNPDVEVQTPAWSPDGQQIAYSSNAGGHFQIYLISATGGNSHPLTQLDADCDSPAWSPDGATLAFSSNQNGQGNLLTIPSSGGSPNLLSTLQDQFLGYPSWAPDGQSIAFMLWRGKTRAVAVINVNGQSWRRISDTNDQNGWPAWSAPKLIQRVFNPSSTSGSSDSTSDNNGNNADQVEAGSIPSVNQRNSPPTGSYRLTGGVGLSDSNAALGPGEFQVEGYCHHLGYSGVRTDYRDWFCSNRQKTVRLTITDFDEICRLTYNNPNAFVIRDGNRDILAYNWRCYGLNGAGSVKDGSASGSGGSNGGVSRCVGFVRPPRLSINGHGRVTPGLPNLINTKAARPSLTPSSRSIGKIPAGGTFSVLDGPVCNDGVMWWKVDYRGTVGWTGEADATGYWVEPVN
ncbi:MAG: DPP IV N-terminal domain-containing protein [Chloroflexota bacterium]